MHGVDHMSPKVGTSLFQIAQSLIALERTLIFGAKEPLKVPKREIFDRSDFPDFYTIKSSWVCDLVVKILTSYFNL